MTIYPVANHQRWVNGYQLNITARLIQSAEIGMMAALEVHTTRIYVYLTKLIEAGATEVPAERNVSAEMAINSDYKWDAFSENRVTVFCWNKKIELTLHSCDEPQQVLNLYYANEAAKTELDTLYPSAPQNAQKTASEPTNTRETAPQAMNTPKTSETGLNDGITRVNGKRAIKELSHNSKFLMPVAKIAAVMSPDGKLKWELYGFYGSNPGKFVDLTIYSDNENSVKNGLNAALTAIVSKPGQSITGKWYARGKVVDKDDKKAIYTNLLFNEQEVLLNEKPQNVHNGYDPDDASVGYPDNENEFDSGEF